MPTLPLSRRQLVQRAVAGLAIAHVGVGCETSEGDSAAEPLALDPLSPISANDEFYDVSYNRPAIPDASWVDTWTLTVSGFGGDDVVLTLDALKALGGEDTEHTLECIGNSPSGKAISNAVWTGISLVDFFAALGLTPTAPYLVFRCGEDYVTTLPLTDLDVGLRLVWAMNGEDLPIGHGAPVRALVPGRYGMKNPKWIVSISASDTWVEGTWEAGGWSPTAEINLISWFRKPDSRSTFPISGGDIIGSAFHGRVPIAKVEVSDDEGQTWQEAEITYNGGENVWSLWRFRWVPSGTGVFTLMVRATDVEGNVQTDEEEHDDDLDGYEGIDSRTYEVA